MSQPLQAGSEPFPGYRLTQVLGSGGYAVVWEAEDPQGQLVALKFLSCVDNHMTPLEIRSLQHIRQLHHPNLVDIYQIWTYQNYIVIAMARAEGSLRDLLECYKEEFGGLIVPEQVCYYLGQAAEALDFLNTRQHHLDGKCVAIQHCDIKPSNLLLFGETVKLCDFGLSSVTTSTV